jgi:hypothetical protein
MTLSLPPEVPAYIRHENHTRNHVVVEGGSNWDFSRSAVATPITAVADPVPLNLVEGDPAYAAARDADCNTFVTTVKFSKGSTTIPLNAQKVLKKLPATSVYTIEAHAASEEPKFRTLAQRRDAAVKAFLLKHGKLVSDKSLTGTASASPHHTPRVDVFTGSGQ